MRSLLAALAWLPLTCPAQGYSMVVRDTEGHRSVYDTERVESVTFEQGTETGGEARKVRVDKNVVFLGHSIWRNDGYVVRYANSGTFATPFSGSFRGRGYQTLLKEVFDFASCASPGPNGGYSGYSLGATGAGDSKSAAVEALNPSNGWPAVRNAVWTVDFSTNDFKRNIPVGALSDYRDATGPATYYGALRQLYDKIKALSGDDVIVVCANALPRNNSGYTSTSKNTRGHTLADYELATLTVAALHDNWLFVDQARQSGITDQNLTAVTADGLHLNNLGYTMAVRPWVSVFRLLAALRE